MRNRSITAGAAVRVIAMLIAFGHMLVAGSRARAQDSQVSDSAEYRAAIDEAVREFKEGVWTQARGAFARAHELQPSARTFRGLGLSSFYLADYVAARIAFEQALADARRPLTVEQRDELARLLARAVQETGRYRLQVSPPSTRVVVDDIPRATDTLVLARGTHTLRARENGFRPYESTWVVNGGEDALLEITLDEDPKVDLSVANADATKRDASQAPITPTSNADTEASDSRTYTWVALAAVPVFAGVGAAIWLTGLSKHEELEERCNKMTCSESELNKLDKYETWTTVFVSAAAASLVTAGVLYFVEGRPASDSSSAELPVRFTSRGFAASF